MGARRPNLVLKTVSQIVSVDVASGDRIVHSSGPGLKLFPQFLNEKVVAYHQKGGPNEGLAYDRRRRAEARDAIANVVSGRQDGNLRKDRVQAG